jgi:hypothetical protein
MVEENNAKNQRKLVNIPTNEVITWLRNGHECMFGCAVLALQASSSTFIRIVLPATTCANGAFATKVAVAILHYG